MDILDNGYAGGLSTPRKFGIKVQMAGKTMTLPNSEFPNVLQPLTLKQIAAIPKDQFVVELIEPVKSFAANNITNMARRPLSYKQQIRKYSIKNSVIGFKTCTLPDTINIKDDGSKEYFAIVKLISQVGEHAGNLFSSNRELVKNQKENPLPDSGIFYPPIDEDALSECILDIIGRFFGVNDTGKICGREYKLAEFCLLMHYYFIRIGILDNKTRKPFCLYLQTKVFRNSTRFSVKTFNNYANNPKYVKVEQDFTESRWLDINFKYHPEPDGKPLHNAFQEIGCAFHNSTFFNELRELRERMETFKI